MSKNNSKKIKLKEISDEEFLEKAEEVLIDTKKFLFL